MADIKQAVDFVLRQEDSRLSGEITTLPGDRGGRTRFGIAERFHPDLTRSGYFDSMPPDEALETAEEIYAEQYGAGLHLDRIDSQEVANRLLSFAVNEGPHEAVTIAQRACIGLGCDITDDGQVGPATIKALNSVEPEAWLNFNRSLQEAFYRHLVTTQPNLMPYLHGLLRRANA